MIPVLSAKEAQKDNGTTNPLTVCSVFPVIESTKNVREWKMYFCYDSIWTAFSYAGLNISNQENMKSLHD